MSGKAIVSAVLGLLSFGLTLLTGIPALLLGLSSLREINQSEGRLRGRPLAVAGMLMGGLGTLLCPIAGAVIVVNTLRERANRTMCEHHLGQIGIALHHYHDDKNAFPAATCPSLELPVEKRLSWMAAALPFAQPSFSAGKRTDIGTVADKPFDLTAAWDAPLNRAAVQTPVRWYRCPSSDRVLPRDEPAQTDFVGNAGIGRDAAALPIENRRAGFFGYERKLTRNGISGGISNTMMALESTWEIGPWAVGGYSTVRGLEREQAPYLGAVRPFGGLHPKGCNVLFADTSVRFVRDNIRDETFEQLATIHADR